jgi:hypothetical protein
MIVAGAFAVHYAVNHPAYTMCLSPHPSSCASYVQRFAYSKNRLMAPHMYAVCLEQWGAAAMEASVCFNSDSTIAAISALLHDSTASVGRSSTPSAPP